MLWSTHGGKSDSKWLDRLRSNKGFPTDDNLDLDHFLHNPICRSPIHSPSNCGSAQFDNDERAADEKKAKEVSSENCRDDREWLGLMSNVLSELFNMGDNEVAKFSGKKSSRKQTNPRMCVVSVSDNNSQLGVGEDGNAPVILSLNSDDNLAEVKEEKCSGEGEKEKGDKDLLGFSRSEVTVIDTSCAGWKFDKLVFRRKNVWKVREKKEKSWSFIGRKKRKMETGGLDGNKKKAKVWGSEYGLSKEVNGEEFLAPTNEGQKSQIDKTEEVRKEKTKELSEVPKKRFPFPKLPKKVRKDGSSTCKKSKNLHKNRHKDSQKQCKT